MTDKIKAIALKPLDGGSIGDEMEFDKTDFDRLVELNAVKAAPGEKQEKAPANKKAEAPINKSK